MKQQAKESLSMLRFIRNADSFQVPESFLFYICYSLTEFADVLSVLLYEARERIELLLDEDSPFLELCALAGYDQDDMTLGKHGYKRLIKLS